MDFGNFADFGDFKATHAAAHARLQLRSSCLGLNELAATHAAAQARLQLGSGCLGLNELAAPPAALWHRRGCARRSS